MRAAVAGSIAMLVAAAASGAAGTTAPRELVYAGALRPSEAAGPRVDQVSDLFVVGADGSQRRRLTRTTWAEETPSWSPDGRRIAFARGLPACHANVCSGLLESGLWTIPATGGPARRVTRGAARRLVDTSPSWSPDARRIAFVRRHCCDAADADGVYLVGADGKGLKRLTSERALAVAWSPRGTKLAIAPEAAPPHVRDGSTGEMRQLATSGLPAGVRVAGLAWSPDGGRVALATSAGLYVVRAGRAVRIGPRRNVTGVDWSRDGRELAFAASDLFVLRADGSRLRRLTRTEGPEVAPSWRP